MKFLAPLTLLLGTSTTTLAAPLLAPRTTSTLAFTNSDYTSLSLTTGAPLALTWAGNTGAVTINLKSGEANDLKTIGTVASGVWGTSTSWAPAAAGTYAFEIIDSAGFVNYSPQFWVSA